jgi:threonine dehydrogenase-like Zn-dependent dehydrogenase
VRALVFQGKQRVAYESVPDPRVLEPTDVIVEVKITAICGSDLHPYHERERGLDPGTVMGHEAVGVVVETGRDVRALAKGDLVYGPFTTCCGACFYCARGLPCRCTKGQLFGWVSGGKGLQGLQAEYARVPLADTTLARMPGDLAPEEALLLGDVLSTGYYCAERAEVTPGGTYAVVGCGPVGVMAVVGARELGAERVYAVDGILERLALAERAGAIPIDRRRTDPVAIVREATDGRGADAVLEAVGSAPASRLAIDLVRPGGTISSVGVHAEKGFAFDPSEAYDKNLTYRIGRCPARRLMETLADVVRRRRDAITPVVSHRLPLRDGARAYAMFDAKEDGCTKVVLTP